MGPLALRLGTSGVPTVERGANRDKGVDARPRANGPASGAARPRVGAWSGRRDAAGDVECLAAGIGPRGRGEKDVGRRELCRLTGSTQWRVLTETGQLLLRL